MGTLYVVLAVVTILFIVRFTLALQKAHKRGGKKEVLITLIFMLAAALVAFFIIRK